MLDTELIEEEYDPLRPNDYMMYCKHRLEQRKEEERQAELARFMEESEAQRSQLEKERQRLLMEEGGSEQINSANTVSMAPPPPIIATTGIGRGRGRGRGMNMPAWMTNANLKDQLGSDVNESERDRSDIGIDASISDDGKPESAKKSVQFEDAVMKPPMIPPPPRKMDSGGVTRGSSSGGGVLPAPPRSPTMNAATSPHSNLKADAMPPPPPSSMLPPSGLGLGLGKSLGKSLTAGSVPGMQPRSLLSRGRNKAANPGTATALATTPVTATTGTVSGGLFTNPSKVVLLQNMVAYAEVTALPRPQDRTHFLFELEEETKMECQRQYGNVKKCTAVLVLVSTKEGAGARAASSTASSVASSDAVVVERGPGGEEVRVFLSFERQESAVRCLVGMGGRFFAKRQIVASFYQENLFDKNTLGGQLLASSTGSTAAGSSGNA